MEGGITGREMEYFSYNDIAAARHRVEKQIARYQELLENAEQSKERYRIKGEAISDKVQKNYESHQNSITRCLSKLQKLSTMPQPLGHVLCSSGKGLWNGRVQDWALIKLSAESSPFCKLNTIPAVEYGNESDMYGYEPLGLQEDRKLFGFNDIRPGEWYYRVGRSSRSEGVCNGVFVCCNWNQMTRYDLNGHPVTGVIREYPIMNRRTEGRRRGEQEKFGENGDFGSLVINAEGKVCGLYYGNATSWMGPTPGEVLHGSAGLAMTMTDLLDGIEMRLGGEVSLDLPSLGWASYVGLDCSYF